MFLALVQLSCFCNKPRGKTESWLHGSSWGADTELIKVQPPPLFGGFEGFSAGCTFSTNSLQIHFYFPVISGCGLASWGGQESVLRATSPRHDLAVWCLYKRKALSRVRPLKVLYQWIIDRSCNTYNEIKNGWLKYCRVSSGHSNRSPQV